MGEPQGWLFEPSFNRSVKVTASDARLTSDGGLVLLREADHRLGISEWLAQRLDDPRNPDQIRYQLVELLRARIYALALGYSAQDDADRLAHDPAMKLAAWNRPGQQPLAERLASQPTQSRLSGLNSPCRLRLGQGILALSHVEDCLVDAPDQATDQNRRPSVQSNGARIQLQHGDIKSAAYQLTHYRSIERPECS